MERFERKGLGVTKSYAVSHCFYHSKLPHIRSTCMPCPVQDLHAMPGAATAAQAAGPRQHMLLHCAVCCSCRCCFGRHPISLLLLSPSVSSSVACSIDPQETPRSAFLLGVARPPSLSHAESFGLPGSINGSDSSSEPLQHTTGAHTLCTAL